MFRNGSGWKHTLRYWRCGSAVQTGYYQGCESRYTHVSACCTAGSPNDDMNFTCEQLGENGTNGTQRGSEFALGYDWWKTGPAPTHGGGSIPDLSVNHTSSALLLRDASVDFIRRAGHHPDRPFFLYVPFQNVHAPYTVAEEYRQLYATGAFTADERTLFGYISEMDDAVGAIVAALNTSTSASGPVVMAPRYANSVIIFSSDNVCRPEGSLARLVSAAQLADFVGVSSAVAQGAPPNPAGADHKRGRFPGYIARNHPFRGHKALLCECYSTPPLPLRCRTKKSRLSLTRLCSVRGGRHTSSWVRALSAAAIHSPRHGVARAFPR